MLEQLTITGTEQTVITDFDEAWWEDVLEEAADELWRGDGARLELVGSRFLVIESDVAIFETDQAMIGDGHAKDVRSKVFESGEAAADRLGVDHPSLLPDAGRNVREQFGLFQFITKLGAEDF